MDEFKKLQQEYIAALPEKVRNIRIEAENAIAALTVSKTPNFSTLEKIVHKLAGSAGTYGFSRLSHLASEMENFISENQWSKLPPKKAAQKIREWLTDFLNEAGAITTIGGKAA